MAGAEKGRPEVQEGALFTSDVTDTAMAADLVLPRSINGGGGGFRRAKGNLLFKQREGGQFAGGGVEVIIVVRPNGLRLWLVTDLFGRRIRFVDGSEPARGSFTEDA